MKSEYTDDSKIIEHITSMDARLRESALKYLFYNEDIRKTIWTYIQKAGGTQEEMNEVYQETLIFFERYIRNGHFEARSPLSTLLIAIAKNIFAKNYRKETQRKQAEEDFYNDQSIEINNEIDDKIIINERDIILHKVISSLAEKCKNILRMWALGVPMETIASDLGLFSEASAKKEVYRCRQHLITYLKAHPQIAEMLRYNG